MCGIRNIRISWYQDMFCQFSEVRYLVCPFYFFNFVESTILAAISGLNQSNKSFPHGISPSLRRANGRNSSTDASGSTGALVGTDKGRKVGWWDECKISFPDPLAIMSFMRLYSSGPCGFPRVDGFISPCFS